MKLKTKKLLTKISTGIFFLLGSIEYAVILPTIWAYISSDPYDAEPYFLGLCLSAFSLTGLLTAPIYGVWYDKTNKTKMIILFSNLWEIAGNFMYFVGISKYFILASRLVAGIGTGCSSAIFAHIAKTTTEEERTAAITVAMVARELGLLFGPGLNIFLDSLDFYIGPWHVNEYTAPGIFMVLLWVIMELIIIFMYFDLPSVEEQERMLIAEKQIQSDYLDDSTNQSIVGDLPTPISIQSPHLHISITNTPPHLPTYLSSSWQEPQY
ncbi:major facilitator superfamily domain-containing protein 8-like [Glandiceps talaboti]